MRLNKLKFDFRIFVPVFYLISFIYISINNLSVRNVDISDNTLPAAEVVATATPICEEILYENQSTYTVLSDELNETDLVEFKRSKINGIEYISQEGSAKILNINKATISMSLNLIAYVYSPDEYANEGTDFVILKNINTGEEKIIYQLEREKKGYEYIKKLTGVSFSNDSKRLAITTGESLGIYDIDSGKYTEIFHDQTDYSGKFFGVFAYSVPYKWPVNNKIFLREGYYEGGGASVLDLNTGEKKSLEYMLYGYGTAPLGFYNDRLLISKISEKENNGITGGKKSDIYLVNIETFEEEYLFTIDGSVSGIEMTESGNMYFVSYNHYQLGNYPCSKSININTLNKYNFDTGEVNEILVSDVTFNNNYRNLSITKFTVSSINENNILLNMSWGDVPMLYLLNQNNPTELIQINNSTQFQTNDALIKSDVFWELANKERRLNGVSALVKDNNACNISQKIVDFSTENNRVPQKSDYEIIFKNAPFSYVNAMTGIYMRSESEAINAFKDNLQEKSSEAFADGKFTKGCIVTKGSSLAFTYAY